MMNAMYRERNTVNTVVRRAKRTREYFKVNVVVTLLAFTLKELTKHAQRDFQGIISVP
jgi:hypothetical protein